MFIITPHSKPMLFSAVHTCTSEVYMEEYSTQPGKEGELKTFKHLTHCWSENTPQKFFKPSCFGFDWKFWLIADLVKKWPRSLDLHTSLYPAHHGSCKISVKFHWSCSLVFQWLYETCSLIFSQSCLSVILQGYKRVLKYHFFLNVWISTGFHL